MFSFCSHGVKRPKTPVSAAYEVRDANGFRLALVYFRDDLQKLSFGHGHLTSDEARRIAKAIARLPEFLIQRRDFCQRGGGDRWKPSRPYHVALEDSYVRAHWDEIEALCKLNAIPFDATGEKTTPAACGASMSSRGSWTQYNFGTGLRADGCAEPNFTIPSGQRTYRR
ncbi:hypothetical protein [Bradyrhizobium canariense]|uniref:Uncharacterized protein n=1 Tax=Bradyrhizobium canariense TaxID=255045 RepID=A0A1H1UXH2_9BRAD|nr:hypothetical protein [Bradyrhizobium canariense]SDS77207.1 hypothetical protein SAMN05444158_3148 [Bradyrhizobium canariense]